MPASLIFYSDSQLTQQIFSLPLGTIDSAYTLAEMDSYQSGGKTIYYYTGNQNKLSNPAVTPYDMQGKSFEPVHTDGLHTLYLRYTDQGAPQYSNVRWGAWYTDRQIRGSGGSNQGTYNVCAAQFDVEGVPFITIGFFVYDTQTYIGFLIISQNAFGKKAMTQKYGDDTDAPGTGLTANGGWGAYDFSSDNVGISDIPQYPTMPVNQQGGHLHLYMIDQTAYNSLSRYLWGLGSSGDITEGLLWSKFKNYKFNPIAAVIACHRLPHACYPIPGQSTGRIDIAGTALGSTAAPLDGLIYPIDANVQEIAVGSIVVPEQYGTFLDYEGGVKIDIVLPFCGRFSLDPSAILGATTSVKYRFDRLTGNCCAFVLIHRRDAVEGEADDLILTATGNAAQPIPFTGHDDGSVQMLGTLTSAALGTVGGAVMGNPLAAATSALSGVKNAIMQQEHTQITGDCSGGVSYVSGLNCYLIISYARPIKTEHYDNLYGRPTFYGAHVGDYTGLTFFDNVEAEISGAEPEEQEEIRRLLQGGVIL